MSEEPAGTVADSGPAVPVIGGPAADGPAVAGSTHHGPAGGGPTHAGPATGGPASAAAKGLVSPARDDWFVGGLSEAVGGPLGEHAARPRATRFWTPVRIVLALACLALALHWVQKSPCRDGAWVDNKQYTHFCYTDVLALYYAEELDKGKVPYKDHPVEYPVVTGAFMGLIGLPVHALGQTNPGLNQGQAFYDLNAFVLGGLGVTAVAVILLLRRRRPWDASMLALAPALLVSATVNWDLLTVGLAALGMYLWARKYPVAAGVLIGLATAAKLYPVFLYGAMLVLAIRSNRWRGFLVALGTGVGTWLLVNVPVALNYPERWLKFWAFNNERGIDWGTLWYIGAHFPRGGEQYGIPPFNTLGVPAVNILYLLLFGLACAGVLALGLAARRRPRLAQLAFLIVAAFLIVGKVWSQQYVLWLIPLAVMARPRWGAFLAWQLAEVGYFVAFYGELLGASSPNQTVFPEWVFVAASLARLITLCVLCGFVVRDILHPARDPVRATGEDDPDGGEFDGAPDAFRLSSSRPVAVAPA